VGGRPFYSYLAIGLLLMSPSRPVAAQQGAIAGRITDATTLAPVPLARVSVVGRPSASGVVSESDGSYELRLADGTYDLLVEAGDFAPVRFDRIRVLAGLTTTRNLALESKGYRLAGFIVTASRGVTESRGERDTEITAPSSSHSVSSTQIEERPAVSPMEHLRESPGVDIATQGLQSSNIVIRGFNNIFSGSMHMLTDNRLAGLPALRVNLIHFLPLNDDDIDRIEVVLGPGAALYGPNTANGVLHVITKSPLESQGTTATLGVGERSVFHGTFRSAFLVNEDFGVKFSGQILHGDEWRYVDDDESSARTYSEEHYSDCVSGWVDYRGLPEEAAVTACTRVGHRDFGILRYSLESRADWRFSPRGTLVATYGRTDDSGIELTGLGAVQTKHWVDQFVQTRLTYDRWFAQAYLNANDAGDTFLLRDGPSLVDHSTLAVAQIQNSFGVADGRFDFTYGWDFFATQPVSDGTIYGDYEDDVAIKEWGAYLQSKVAVTEQVAFIAAGRIDSHSILPSKVFSPRLALVVKPNEDNAIRFAYNRAFSTPTPLNYFLDISAGFVDDLGYTARAFGTGRNGFGWWGPDGMLRGMRSPFNPSGRPGDFIPGVDQARLWNLAVAGVDRGRLVRDGVGAYGPDVVAVLQGLQAPDAADVGIQYAAGGNGLRPIESLVLPDVPPIKEGNTETFELGWSGVLASSLRLSADLYYMRQHDFVSPLTVANPPLFLDGVALGSWLGQNYVPARIQDLTSRLGLTVDSASAQATDEAYALANTIGSNPLAVVSSDVPEMANGGADYILTYRNVGTLGLWGADFALRWAPKPQWTLSATYSHVSRSSFAIESGDTIYLNAPVDKATFGMAYRSEAHGLGGSARIRYTGPFHVDATDFNDDIYAYALIDLTLGYKVPSTAATVQLGVSNLLNTGYRSFAGVPTIGRLGMVRLRYELF